MSELRKANLLWPTIAAAIVLSVLVALGSWQMQRKAWKDGLIAQIEAGLRGEPMGLDRALLRSFAGENLEYSRIRARGRFLADRERYYWAPTAGGTGWHVYAPFEAVEGWTVIVNRGLVLDRDRDPASRPEPAVSQTEIVGLLRRSEVKGPFTPDNDEVRNLWYWRDLAGMVRSMLPEGRKQVAPFFLDAERGLVPPPAPQGGVTNLAIPNSHLQYAVTWYGLAATLVGVYLAFAWGRMRSARATTPRTT